jgi:putative transcriptional regulator
MTGKAFEKIAAGLREARAFDDFDSETVHVPRDVDARAIRQKLGLSQGAFAARFGIPVATLRDWERRRRRPEGPGRVLLTVIEREPDAVSRALTRR